MKYTKMQFFYRCTSVGIALFLLKTNTLAAFSENHRANTSVKEISDNETAALPEQQSTVDKGGHIPLFAPSSTGKSDTSEQTLEVGNGDSSLDFSDSGKADPEQKSKIANRDLKQKLALDRRESPQDAFIKLQTEQEYFLLYIVVSAFLITLILPLYIISRNHKKIHSILKAMDHKLHELKTTQASVERIQASCKAISETTQKLHNNLLFKDPTLEKEQKKKQLIQSISELFKDNEAPVSTSWRFPIKTSSIDAEWEEWRVQSEAPMFLDEIDPKIALPTICDIPTPEKVSCKSIGCKYARNMLNDPTSLSETEEMTDFFTQLSDKEYDPLVNWCPDTAGERVIWILGDTHGDAKALAATLDYIEQKREKDRKNHYLVFLGDMVDRTKDIRPFLHIFCKYLKAKWEYGKNWFYIVGNHDIGLHYDDETSSFSSSSKPCEFVDQFNANKNLHDLGKSMIAFFKSCPVAHYLPIIDEDRNIKFLLLTHGGVPHDDVLKAWNSAQEQDSPLDKLPEDIKISWKKDHVWTRIVHQAADRSVNRGISGLELGRTNIKIFTILFEEKIGYPLGGNLRGHDHPSSGYEVTSPEFRAATQCDVITANVMSQDDESSLTGDIRYPILMRWNDVEKLKLLELSNC